MQTGQPLRTWKLNWRQGGLVVMGVVVMGRHP